MIKRPLCLRRSILRLISAALLLAVTFGLVTASAYSPSTTEELEDEKAENPGELIITEINRYIDETKSAHSNMLFNRCNGCVPLFDDTFWSDTSYSEEVTAHTYEINRERCIDCVPFNDIKDIFCENDFIYESSIMSSPPPPSVPCCFGFSMTWDGASIHWLDLNTFQHRFRTINAWLCDRSGCNRETLVINDIIEPHTFSSSSDGGHNTGLGTHNWVRRCTRCGRIDVRADRCPGPPCPSPMTVPDEVD
jgi:hypothetical protein